jgi:hypothetical protein
LKLIKTWNQLSEKGLDFDLLLKGQSRYEYLILALKGINLASQILHRKWRWNDFRLGTPVSTTRITSPYEMGQECCANLIAQLPI